MCAPKRNWKDDREALQRYSTAVGPESSFAIKTMGQLDAAILDQGRYAEAERLLRNTHALDYRVYGKQSAETASTMYNLACATARQGRTQEATSLLKTAIEIGIRDDVTKDADLISLHGDPRFQALVAEQAKRLAKTAQSQTH